MTAHHFAVVIAAVLAFVAHVVALFVALALAVAADRLGRLSWLTAHRVGHAAHAVGLAIGATVARLLALAGATGATGGAGAGRCTVRFSGERAGTASAHSTAGRAAE